LHLDTIAKSGIDVSTGDISSGRHVIELSEISPELLDSWKSSLIPDRQRSLVETELSRMYNGDVVGVYRILCEAVARTKDYADSVIEIGCSSGYYSEVLSHLLNCKVNYFGLDYSEAMIYQAKKFYQELPFVVGDTCALPFKCGSFELVISAGVLLQVFDYTTGIRETARIARKWVIFHRMPVVQKSPTVCYKKLAYEVPCIEWAFNEDELLGMFKACGLELVDTWVIGEVGMTRAVETGVGKTYLCRLQKG
jgi:SAM-dependent methyltransferase